MKKNLLLLLASCLISLFFAEMALRFWYPGLGSDLFRPPARQESVHSLNSRTTPFLFNSQVGYEFKPFAPEKTIDGRGNPSLERMNSDGFKGPEYAIPRPPGVFRILVLGDSVAQGFVSDGFFVSYRDSWPHLLEEALNRRAAPSPAPIRYEVINAAVGGYVSWQVLRRLESRGLKYSPDLVLVLVGWNDMFYSSLPEWKPGLTLSQIERAYVARQTTLPQTGSQFPLKMLVYRISYTARLIRQARNGVWNALRVQKLIRNHQVNSGMPFNQQALDLYRANLEQIYQVTRSGGARLGLILWPTVLAPELLDDPDVHRKLLVFYSSGRLSTREVWAWYNRYIETQRQFAFAHPDVLLVDAPAAFAGKTKKERLRLFTDLSHVRVEGNRLIAGAVFEALEKDSVRP